jgi:hypothetical protein
MANLWKQSSMPELSAVQKQTSTRIVGWFDWMRWNRHNYVNNQGDTAKTSLLTKQTSQDVCSSTDRDKLSTESVKMNPGL